MIAADDFQQRQAVSCMRARSAWLRPLSAAMLAFALAACGGGGGSDESAAPNAAPATTNGTAPLVATVPEPAGANCPEGGTKLSVGTDADANGTLDATEATSTPSFVCNNAPARALGWIDVTGPSIQALADTGYLANSAEQVTITLPAALDKGAVVHVNGLGKGGWKVAQNPGQSILVDNLPVPWIASGISRNWDAIASSASGDILLALDGDNGIHISRNWGKEWSSHFIEGEGVEGRDVASSGSGEVLVVSAYQRQPQLDEDGEVVDWIRAYFVYISKDSGQTWNKRATPDGFDFVASSYDGDLLVGGVWQGQLYTSKDYGETWVGNPDTDFRQWVRAASSKTGDVLVTAEEGGQISVSRDVGMSWKGNPDTDNKNWSDVAASADGSKLVAVEYGGRIYTSDNFGVTWTAHGPEGSWISVALSAEGDKMVVLAANDHIYTSTDGGQTLLKRDDSTRDWVDVAVSADGSKVAAMPWRGPIYTPAPTRTTLGTDGSISGRQYDAIELMYIGEGVFYVLSHTVGATGGFTVQ